MNKEIMLTLKLAIVGQMYLEMLEEYERLPKNKFKRKSLIKQLNKEFDVDIFNKAFFLDEETMRVVQQRYNYSVESIAKGDIPSIVLQSQMWEAHEIDSGSMEANVHRILKKSHNNPKY